MSRLKNSVIALSFVGLLCGSAGFAQQQDPNLEEHAVVSRSVSKDPHQDVERVTGTVKPLVEGPSSLRRCRFPVPHWAKGLCPSSGISFPLRKSDTVSPASVVGVAGLVTNNGSRGFAACADLFFGKVTHRVTSGYLRGNINYDLYGIGLSAGREGLKLPLE